MNFHLLHTLLVSHVRSRVRNGEISERGLARITGISQPHIHNVLKGARLLSMDMADQILQRLRIDLMNLTTDAQARPGVEPSHEPADEGEYRMVAMLDGLIGREHPYPQSAGRERYPFPAAALERLRFPVAARLAPDPLRAPILSGSGVVLLDRAEEARREPDEDRCFALDLFSGGTIGRVQRAGRRLHLRVRQADVWQSIPLPDRSPLDVIQGRVSLLVREL